MNQPLSLKSAERKAFQTTFADGLWDIFIGCFALEFVIALFLSESMGDFWSSAIFLPFCGVVYLAIWLTRKYVVAPRLGTVSFGKVRRLKLRRFSILMVVINTLMFGLGILAFINYGRGLASGSAGVLGAYSNLLGLFLLLGFSTAAYLLDCPRLYFYGLLLFIAIPVGEWLYANHGAVHHGFPIAFGITAAVMIITGLVLFIRLLINNPVVEGQEA